MSLGSSDKHDAGWMLYELIRRANSQAELYSGGPAETQWTLIAAWLSEHRCLVPKEIPSSTRRTSTELRAEHDRYHETGMCYGDSHADMTQNIERAEQVERTVSASALPLITDGAIKEADEDEAAAERAREKCIGANLPANWKP